jgi:hypothetical protein
MIPKFDNTSEYIVELELLDSKLALCEHEQRYGDMELLLAKRASVISELTRLKKQGAGEFSEQDLHKIRQSWEHNNYLNQMIEFKKDQIAARLLKRKQIKRKIKKSGYSRP